jgi:hypothetical protein
MELKVDDDATKPLFVANPECNLCTCLSLWMMLSQLLRTFLFGSGANTLMLKLM